MQSKVIQYHLGFSDTIATSQGFPLSSDILGDPNCLPLGRLVSDFFSSDLIGCWNSQIFSAILIGCFSDLGYKL